MYACVQIFCVAFFSAGKVESLSRESFFLEFFTEDTVQNIYLNVCHTLTRVSERTCERHSSPRPHFGESPQNMGQVFSKRIRSTYVPAFIIRALLYGTAPFFGNPIKPLLCLLDGANYKAAYVHFRQDHHNNLNILLHVLCLVGQVCSNFAFLAELDNKLELHLGTKSGDGQPLNLISSLTVVIWSVVLVLTTGGAPSAAKLGGIASIYAAYKMRKQVCKLHNLISKIAPVLEAWAVQALLFGKNKLALGEGSTFSLKQFAFILAARLSIKYFVSNNISFKGRKSLRMAKLVRILVVAGMVLAAQGGVEASVKLGFTLWLPALLTGDRWMYFLYTGFLSSMLQGTSHHYSREQATLPNLAKLSDELAHVNYFPVLLLHTVQQSIFRDTSSAAHFW